MNNKAKIRCKTTNSIIKIIIQINQKINKIFNLTKV